MTCQVCTHLQVNLIDKDLILGDTSLRKLGEKWGIEHTALHRHKHNHIDAIKSNRIIAKETRDVEAAAAKGDVDTITGARDSIIKRLNRCVTMVEGILDRSDEREDDAFTLVASKEFRSVLIDMTKLQGMMNQEIAINVSLTDSSPEWLALRSILVETFRDHPEAEARFVELAKPLRITPGGRL